MPYTVTRSDGVATIAIADGGFNTADTSIPLLGQNVTNYGENVATAFVHLLENFNHSAAPSNPIQGQLWFDNSSGAAGELKVRIGSNWIRMAQFNSNGHLVPTAHNTFDLGTSAARWRTVYSVTFEAGGADLAERYEADTVYSEGTVIKIGGEREITATTQAMDANVFGVISGEPGLALNTGAGSNATHPYVAVAGRVKVRTLGPVLKGQRLVASDVSGVAVAVTEEDAASLSPFAVIGRALEDKLSEGEGTVLAVVGNR